MVLPPTLNITLCLNYAYLPPPDAHQGLEYKRICKEMEDLNKKKEGLDAKVMALAQVGPLLGP